MNVAAADRLEDAALIEATLSAAAERGGDITAGVYAALFGRQPELEELFWMDQDRAVRGSMVQTTLECVLDQIGPRTTARFIVPAARLQHDGYGLPAETFDLFFEALREAVRAAAGPAWSPAANAAWDRLIADFAAMR